MSPWPEMARLCSLLAERDEVAPAAVVAVADQLDALAAEHPDTVRRGIAVAVLWCKPASTSPI